MTSVLIDTGPVVAITSARDSAHRLVAAWLSGFRGKLVTTEAVVTEAAYVATEAPGHRRAALGWLQKARESGILTVHPIPDYLAVMDIIDRYGVERCDFADASLIDLAQRTGVTQIATLDRRDFSVYRLSGNRHFELVLPSA